MPKKRQLKTLDRPYFSAGPADAPGVELRQIWEVRANRHYAYQRASPDARDFLVAVRTACGVGCVRFWNGNTIYLPGGSLAILKLRDIAFHGTHQANWCFVWFVFVSLGVLPLPIGVVMRIPHLKGEESDIRDACHGITCHQTNERKLASIAFNKMMHGWGLAAGKLGANQPKLGVVEKSIAMMHATLSRPLDVKEIAGRAGMSEPHFRKIFRAITGQSPKKFYDRLRFAEASALLGKGMTVAEIADRLGFSSPFHFSRQFKKEVGQSPIHFRGFQ